MTNVGVARDATPRPARERAAFATHAEYAPPDRLAATVARPRVAGKFLAVGDAKFVLRGVTYGTFRPRPDAAGETDYPEPAWVARDFAAMAAHGLNTVRVYTVPPRWLLDCALAHGLRVMVGLPWEQHVAFLDGRDRAADIERRVREGVRACAGHPAVLAYAVGNEIPAPVVRWTGRRAVEQFVERLYRAVKAEDPEALVTYVNYPSTEYLVLPFVDFVCFNVYLERRELLDGYLARLQNQAGDRPLVLAELGLDSRRNGETRQAESLGWQLRAALAGGCAGAFVFSWTDEWHRGGFDVDDWDFGLVDRDRRPKPALAAVADAFGEPPHVPDGTWPRMSVVVCTYNGSRTIADCLAGLERQTYANHEVIVVDDGSTDATAAIVEAWAPRLPQMRLVRIPNGGLSAARNVGLREATGDVVSYTDDDARPDPDWLLYMAAAFRRSSYVAIGGPNIPPPGDGPIAECVANAPGGPIHVLVSDTEAEHVPGCNMSVRREALAAIGGFDPTFRVAGDDVDVCWRLQQAGGTIGFCPAAFVWHHRRNSLRTYWKQQKGYGKAEALLEAKWPEKYNAAGHVTWSGRLYGFRLHEAVLRRHGRVYHGVWGCAPFQMLYGPAGGTMWTFAMPEWNLVSAALALTALLAVEWPVLLWAAPLLAMSVGVQVSQAVLASKEARFPSTTGGRAPARLVALTAALHLAQPFARLVGRWGHGLTPWRWCRWPGFASPMGATTFVWDERWQASEARLEAVRAALVEAGAVVGHGGALDTWDLGVRGGLIGGTQLALLAEDHHGGRQLVRVRDWPRVRPAAVALAAFGALIAPAAVADRAWATAAVMALGSLLLVARGVYECGKSAAAARGAVRRVAAACGAHVVDERSARAGVAEGREALPRETVRLAAVPRAARPLVRDVPATIALTIDAPAVAADARAFDDMLLRPAVPPGVT